MKCRREVLLQTLDLSQANPKRGNRSHFPLNNQYVGSMTLHSDGSQTHREVFDGPGAARKRVLKALEQQRKPIRDPGLVLEIIRPSFHISELLKKRPRGPQQAEPVDYQIVCWAHKRQRQCHRSGFCSLRCWRTGETVHKRHGKTRYPDLNALIRRQEPRVSRSERLKMLQAKGECQVQQRGDRRNIP